MPALPEGVPGPSSRVPEGEAAATRPSGCQVDGTEETAAGRSRQRQDVQVRLTPASHNAQTRALMLRHAEALEGVLKLMTEQEENRKEFRKRQLENDQALMKELQRFNNIMDAKRSSKRRRDSDSE